MAVNKSNQKTMEANHRGLSFLVTLLFAVLCFFIAFPLLAGLLASFRPGRELVQNGLAINWDFKTMTLDNYLYLFGLAGVWSDHVQVQAAGISFLHGHRYHVRTF